MSVPISNGTPISVLAPSQATPVSARPNSKFIYQALSSLAKLPGDSEIEPVLKKMEAVLEAGQSLDGALESLSPEQREILQQRIGHHSLEEFASLEKERDSELFWSAAIHAVERRERQAQDDRLPAVLGTWLSNRELSPELSSMIGRKLEVAQGRGPFGARAEFFLSRLNRQAFDPKAVAPMFAAGLLGKAVQVAALGRLSAAAPAWWSRGALARSVALTAGFGSEVAILGSAHGDFSRSALSLAVMKAGLWGGNKASLPIPMSLVGATALGLKAEEKLGWRAPSSLADSLAEASVSAFHFGLGMSLAARILGPRFRELQTRLQLANPPSANFPGSASLLSPRFAVVHGAPPPAESPLALTRPMQMSAIRIPSAIPGSGGKHYPFELEFAGRGFEGRRLLAVRDDSQLWAEVEKKSLVEKGDPITPSGVTRVNFRLEEGDTRGKAFLYYDSKAVTLFFIDLEESMITGGPPMRPGSGSVFMTWLAHQARREGKAFNVTRITSPQTVRILERMKLADPKARVEACARLNPESYDEEYRVLGEFSFGDKSGWGRYRGEADFFNVFGLE